MRRFLQILLVCLLTALPAFSQNTSLTASHIAQDVSGTLLASGRLCAVPVNQAGTPSGFQNNGVQYMPQQACFTVTSGAISGVTLPDTADNAPSGTCYRLSVTDSTGKNLYNFIQPVCVTGTTFSLDTWSPTQSVVVSNPTTVSYSPNAPQGRCGVNPALFYAGSIASGITISACVDQVWVPVTSSGGGALSAASVNAALGYVPVSPTNLSSAIAAIPTLNSANIVAALGYTPTSPTDLTNAIASVPTVTSANIIAALGYTPLSILDLANVLPISGGTLTGPLTLNADPTANLQAATKQYVDNSITAKLSGTGGTGTGTLPTGIGTVNRTGVLTDGTIAYKTCYVGSSVCSGGVGSNAPSSTPQRVAGLASPNASTGTANAVASYSLSTALAQPNFTDVLWTTTGGGLGSDSTSTNWYRAFWVKAVFPAGHTHFEFDTYDFASGWDWMWGTQCNATKNLIQYANQSSSWIDTAVPCGQLLDGNWHHIQQTFHRDLAGTNNCANGTAPCQWWDSIAIDGTVYGIGKSLPATTSTWSGSGGQIQLDTEPVSASSSSPATATVYIDTDTVTAGTAADSGSTGPGGNGGTLTGGTGELLSYSFDSGLPSGAGITVVGSPAISTSNYHSSPNSAMFPAGNNYYEAQLSSPTNVIYTRQYLYITSLGSNANSFLRFYHSGQELFVWYISTGGVVTAYNQAALADIGTGYTYPLGSLHLIETYTKIDPSAGQVILKIDGTVVYTSAATLNTGSATVDTMWFGQIGGTAPVGWGSTYMDNVDASALGFIGPI